MRWYKCWLALVLVCHILAIPMLLALLPQKAEAGGASPKYFAALGNYLSIPLVLDPTYVQGPPNRYTGSLKDAQNVTWTVSVIFGVSVNNQTVDQIVITNGVGTWYYGGPFQPSDILGGRAYVCPGFNGTAGQCSTLIAFAP